MEERIFFESRITHILNNERKLTCNLSGNEWFVSETWNSKYSQHEITLKKYDDCHNMYYAELKVFTRSSKPENSICKLARGSSSNIFFKITQRQYDDLEVNSGGLCEYTIYLLPILKFKTLPTNVHVLKPEEVPNEQMPNVQPGVQEPEAPAEGAERIVEPLTQKEAPELYQLRNIKPKTIKRSKVPFMSGLKSLSTCISSLLVTGELADVILHCGSKKVKAHRNILSARSPYFRRLFERPLLKNPDENPPDDHLKFDFIPEPNSSEFFKITLNNISDTIFEAFLDFLYTGIYKAANFEETKDLFLAAHIYQLEDLEKKCLMSLYSQLTMETVPDIERLATQSGSQELFQMIDKYRENYQ